MEFNEGFANAATVAYRMIRYNLKVIFAGKFVYFMGTALFVFFLVTVINLLSEDSVPGEGMVYRLLFVPGILLVFYPITFGIQNDVDNRMIEILFGIPNYRYKVWLVRLALVYLVVFAVLTVLSVISSLTLAVVPVFRMVFQLMFPVVFLGCAAFMVSTIARSGSGTSVVMVVTGMVFWFARDFFEDHRKWDVFLNPFSIPDNINEAAWMEIVFDNRVHLLAGALVSLLIGLLNLQKREKFLQ